MKSQTRDGSRHVISNMMQFQTREGSRHVISNMMQFQTREGSRHPVHHNRTAQRAASRREGVPHPGSHLSTQEGSQEWSQCQGNQWRKFPRDTSITHSLNHSLNHSVRITSLLLATLISQDELVVSLSISGHTTFLNVWPTCLTVIVKECSQAMHGLDPKDHNCVFHKLRIWNPNWLNLTQLVHLTVSYSKQLKTIKTHQNFQIKSPNYQKRLERQDPTQK